MPRYKVIKPVVAYYEYEVEANSQKEAVEAAQYEYEQGFNDLFVESEDDFVCLGVV